MSIEIDKIWSTISMLDCGSIVQGVLVLRFCNNGTKIYEAVDRLRFHKGTKFCRIVFYSARCFKTKIL